MITFTAIVTTQIDQISPATRVRLKAKGAATTNEEKRAADILLNHLRTAMAEISQHRLTEVFADASGELKETLRKQNQQN